MRSRWGGWPSKPERAVSRFLVGSTPTLFRHHRLTDLEDRLPARLQDILGAINDAATVGNLVGEVLRGANGRHAAEARGILLGWSRGRAATLRRELDTAWKAFRAAEKFW